MSDASMDCLARCKAATPISGAPMIRPFSRPTARGGANLALIFLTLLALPVVGLAEEGDPGPPDSDPTVSTRPADPAADARTLPDLGEEIVVTANRDITGADTVGSSVTVISRQEIELRGKTTIAELLRTVPGVEVARGGGAGQVTSVFIRGGSSSQTLVLLDGLRLNDANTGAYDFANLATDQIERIEIVRGPQSTLYGSEAAAGVIHIVSRRGVAGEGGAPTWGALVEAGEAGHQRLRAHVQGSTAGGDWQIGLSDESQDGVSAASEARGNDEDDPYEITTASARFGWATAAEGRLEFGLRAFDSKVANDGFDFLLGPVDDPNRLQTREGVASSLAWSGRLGRGWRQTVRLGWQDEQLAGSDPDDSFSNFEVESERFEVDLESDLELTERDVLTVGLAFEERRGASKGNFDETVEIASFYLQNAWSGERLHFTAGLRWDDHSQFGDETTYRLAASWRLAPGTRLHGSWGTGFKAPTLNDLYFPFFGNLDLAPETSETVDLGIEQRWLDGRLRLDLTAFESEFDDLIVFDIVTFLPQNIARAEASGVEASLAWHPTDGLHLMASQTWLATEDLATGTPLPRRPESRTTFQLFFEPFEEWVGSLEWFAVADRVDTGGAAMDDYERLDVALRYQLFPGVAPYLRVENLFDEEYEEIPGFTSPGITAVVGVSLGR